MTNLGLTSPVSLHPYTEKKCTNSHNNTFVYMHNILYFCICHAPQAHPSLPPCTESTQDSDGVS